LKSPKKIAPERLLLEDGLKKKEKGRKCITQKLLQPKEAEEWFEDK
jgi:hypothetical protein